LKKAHEENEFTLRYTNSAQVQLEELSFEILSQVEGELERICREEDPGNLGSAEEAVPDRRSYEIGPVQAVAWITRIEPDTRLLTVVEIVFPDKPVQEETPQPVVPPQPEYLPQLQGVPEQPGEPRRRPRRILYPLRQLQAPAEV
jgi:hypothetical protein